MRTLLTLMGFLVALLPAYAQQWEQTSGPEGANVRTMAATDSTLLAIVEPGIIYRHEAAGWTRVAALDAHELKGADGIFMARTLDGFYRSIDRGATWDPIGPSGWERSMAQDGEILYVAIDSTIYRLSEQGGAWTEIALADDHFISFFALGSAVMIGRSGDSAGLYRTDNRGESWRKITAGLPADVIPTVFHRIGTMLYMGTSGQGVFRSADGGESWSAMNEGLALSTGGYPLFSNFASAGDRLWAAGSNGTYLLMNGQWHLRIRTNTRAFAIVGETVYMGTNNRVYRTSGIGDHIEEMNDGLKAQKIDALFPFRNSVLASANGMIYQTTDAGASWLLSWTRPNEISPVRFAGGDDTVYALDNHATSPGIYRSTDGRAWEEAGAEGLPYPLRYISTLAAAEDTLFAGLYRTNENNGIVWVRGGVYRSVDGGEHWSAVNNGLPRRGDVDVPVYDLAVVRGALLAQTLEGLYRSVDGGESWSLVVTGFPQNADLRRFAVAGGKVYLAGIGGVFLSEDAGITWRGINAGLPQELPVQFISVAGETVYVSTYFAEIEGAGHHVYRFNGERWAGIDNQFPAGITPRFFVRAGDKVLAGTAWNSVWRGASEPASVVLPRDGSSDLTVAPNPFRSGLTARFTLEKGGAVRLMLLSLMGEEIGTLHDGTLQSGVYEVEVDGSALASGAYYLRIETPTGVHTTRVMKVR